MAGSVNKCILIGNLGRDPETRTTQSGSKIVNLTVATSETWNDKRTGEKKERTEWHRVSIFNERYADFADRFLRKGRKVYLEGTLRTRKWTDQSGQERFTTEVVLEQYRGELISLDSQNTPQSPGNSLPQNNGSNHQQSQQSRASSWDWPPHNPIDDDIPF